MTASAHLHLLVVLPVLLTITALASSASLVCPRPEIKPKLLILLPLGAQPEGITEGPGPIVFASRAATGGVTAVNVLTGDTHQVVRDTPGRSAFGLYARKRRIFVAGGLENALYVYNLVGGREVARCALEGFGFVNDVVAQGRRAVYTNSLDGFLYALDLDDPSACRVTPIRLRHPDFEPEEGVPKANGITKFRGGLLVAQFTSGAVYFVDSKRNFAVSELIAPGEAESADGLVVDGNTLYVAQPVVNQVGVWKLKMRDDRKVFATKTGVLLSENYNFPSTAALKGEYLYVVNNRFGEINFGEAGPNDEFYVSGVNRFLLG